METTVQIVEVNSKQVQTSRGPSTVFNIKASDGREYSTFKRPLATAAGELRGQTATLGYTEATKGQYTNYYLDSVKPADPVADIQAASPVQVSTGAVSHNITAKPTNSLSEQESISRSVALKAAVELAAAAGYDDPITVIRNAEQYLPWLLGKQEAKPAPLVPTSGEAGSTEAEPGFTETEFPF